MRWLVAESLGCFETNGQILNSSAQARMTSGGTDWHSLTSFIIKGSAQWNKLCSQLHLTFFIVFPCFLIASAYVSHTHIPGCKVTGCLTQIYTQFSEKLISLSLAVDWDYMQFDINACLCLQLFDCLVIAPLSFHEVYTYDQMVASNQVLKFPPSRSLLLSIFVFECWVWTWWTWFLEAEMKSESNASLAIMKI